MRFLTVNNLGHADIVCSLDRIEGNLLWTGNKAEIDYKILAHTLQYYYDKAANKFFFVDYVKWKKIYNRQNLESHMTACLFTEKNETQGLRKSYESLIELMQYEFGRFRKINFIQL